MPEARWRRGIEDRFLLLLVLKSSTAATGEIRTLASRILPGSLCTCPTREAQLLNASHQLSLSAGKESLCRKHPGSLIVQRSSTAPVWNNLLTFSLLYKQPAHSAIPSTLMSAEFLEQI
ncbi:hypothetical protein NQZ68_002559 [Dissostichus eleginoides]|nr:hypothetical protein NQZ68_002559 [Dissostichus eleginoides]